MARYAVLLRGVNVGGHRRVPMAQFAALLESLGLTEVATYVQSGNAVFSAAATLDRVWLAQEIAEGLERDLAVLSTVIVWSAAQVTAVVANLPWPDRVAEPKALHVAFLSAPPSSAAASSIDPGRFEPDEMVLRGQAAYLWYPNGAGRTRLTLEVIERGLGVSGTARNWATVTTLARLTAP